MLFSATDRYRHCIRLGVGGTWNDAQVDALRRVGAIATRLADAQPGTAPGARRAASPATRAPSADVRPLPA